MIPSTSTIRGSQYNYGESLRSNNLRVASFYSYPFVLPILKTTPELSLEDNVVCTGTLVTIYHILTSEHCFDHIGSEPFYVIVGSNDLYCGMAYYPLWFITFNQWAMMYNLNMDHDINDVAVIKLCYPVPNQWITIQLAQISPDSQLFGLSAEMPGWGETNSGEVLRYLQIGNVTILSHQECRVKTARIRGHPVEMPSTFICSVGDPYVLLAAGDSGGPLLYQNTIVAINKGTSPKQDNYFNPEKVNIHVNIDYYRHFIQIASMY